MSKYVCSLVGNWGRSPSKENKSQEPDLRNQTVRQDSVCVILNYMLLKRQLSAVHIKDFSHLSNILNVSGLNLSLGAAASCWSMSRFWPLSQYSQAQKCSEDQSSGSFGIPLLHMTHLIPLSSSLLDKHRLLLYHHHSWDDAKVMHTLATETRTEKNKKKNKYALFLQNSVRKPS